MIVSPTGFRASSQNPFTPTPNSSSGTQVIESDSSMVVREGGWASQAVSSASGGSYLYSSGSEQDALTLPFSGTTIEVLYVAGPNLGTLALEVDGTVLRTVITTAEQTTYQQSVVINYLTNEPHTLRVYAQEGGIVAVDGFIAQLVSRANGVRVPPASAYEIAFNCDNQDICLRTPIPTDPPMQITNTDGYIAPEWSPDGRYILYHRNQSSSPPTSALGLLENTIQNGQPVWVDRGLFTLTTGSISQLEPHTRWSIDGRYIAYTGGTYMGLTFLTLRVYTIDLTQCPSVYQDNINNQITPACPVVDIMADTNPNVNYSNPSWSPDSSRLVYKYSESLTDHLYTARLDGTERTRLITVPVLNHNYGHTHWSSNGQIVFAESYLNDRWLMTMSSSGGSATNLTTPVYPINDNEAVWSPDGSQVVFHRLQNATDLDGLYIINASGGTPTYLGLGSEPSWKRPVACIVAIPGGNDGVKYYRAPITYNPLVGTLPFYQSSTYKFELDAYFTDHRNTTWYRVARVLYNNHPFTPSDPGYADAHEVEQRGGVWIKGSTEVNWPLCNGLDTTTPPTMRYAHEYDIPIIDWSPFTLFTMANNIPVSYSEMCTDNFPEPDAIDREIHSIGYRKPTRGGIKYPLGRHHGTDLFVIEGGTGQIRSIGTTDGIVVAIGEEGNRESHEALGNYGVNEGKGYSVTVRYGHLFVLYGHLMSIPDSIWVGARVRPNDPIGVVGTNGEKHLHLEVFTYQSGNFPVGMDGDGIPPYTDDTYTVTEQDVRQVFLYDFLQLVADSAIATPLETNVLQLPSNFTPVQPIRFDDQRDVMLQFPGAECQVVYITRHPNDAYITEVHDLHHSNPSYSFRGFHYFQGQQYGLPSPLTVPAQHP